jgi:hypothetical protein
MDSPKSRLSSWMILLVAGVFIALSAINLWAQMLYSLNGVPASGKVIEAHAAASRSATIDARVEVAMPGVAPFRWDVEDTFGTQHWEPGGTVPLLCTHIHADHISCVVDSLLDRYLFPSAMLVIGAGVMFWTLKRRSSAGVQ